MIFSCQPPFRIGFPMETLHFGDSPCLIGRGRWFLHGFPMEKIPQSHVCQPEDASDVCRVHYLAHSSRQSATSKNEISAYYTHKVVFFVGPQISQVGIKTCVQQNWNLKSSLSGCVLFIHGYDPRWLCPLQWFSDTQWNTREAPLAEWFYAPPTWSLLGHLVCPNDLSIIYTVKLLYIVF